MSKVTSKLQITIPKAIAVRLGIQPGDEMEWFEAGQALRLTLAGSPASTGASTEQRLQWFDLATLRQQEREASPKRVAADQDRGWTRGELYDRGRVG